MTDYTPEFIIAIIKHKPQIDSYLERVTNELFPSYYSAEDAATFYMQEGNTLTSDAPKTTRIPSKDNLKENLLIWRTDIERAMDQLDMAERIAVIYYFTIYEKGRTNSAETALNAIQKMYEFLNDSFA